MCLLGERGLREVLSVCTFLTLLCTLIVFKGEKDLAPSN